MSKKTIIGVSVLLALALLLWLWFQPSYNSHSLLISGNIEITQVQVAFRVPGQLKQRLVEEGDYVKEGQVIAVLDEVDLEQQVKASQAEVIAAKAALKELVNGSLPEEIAAAQAKVDQTKADLTYLEANHGRQQELFERQVISAREYESSTSAFEVAEARYKEAVEHLNLLQKGSREELIMQGRAKFLYAKEMLNQAKTRLSYATLLAPLSGFVLSVNVEPGEVVNAGLPIVSIGDLQDIWLRGYIDERDLGKVKLGQRVEVTTDSYPGKIYPGKVTFISSKAEFTPKNVQTYKERVKLVYLVKITLDNALQELKPGMPADGKILLDKS